MCDYKPGECCARGPGCWGCGNNPDLRSDYCGRTSAECAEAGGTGDCDLCKPEPDRREVPDDPPEALMHPEDDR